MTSGPWHVLAAGFDSLAAILSNSEDETNDETTTPVS